MSNPTAATEIFEQALAYLEQGELGQAMASFELATREEPGNARFQSYHGLSIGLATGDFERATELCRSAAKREFFNPEQYLNLARVYLAFGFKVEGLRYLRRGQMIAPDHPGIQLELNELGMRTQPVLSFLPRGHRVNRWLGVARSYLARRSADPLAA